MIDLSRVVVLVVVICALVALAAIAGRIFGRAVRLDEPLEDPDRCTREAHRGCFLLRGDLRDGYLHLSLVCSVCWAPVKELGRLARSVIVPPGGWR